MGHVDIIWHETCKKKKNFYVNFRYKFRETITFFFIKNMILTLAILINIQF
jgi:hypothetical protein